MSKGSCEHVCQEADHTPFDSGGIRRGCCTMCPAPGCDRLIAYGLLNPHVRTCHVADAARANTDEAEYLKRAQDRMYGFITFAVVGLVIVEGGWLAGLLVFPCAVLALVATGFTTALLDDVDNRH